MPAPKPPSPPIPDAINTQIPAGIPGLPGNPATDFGAQNMANALQQAQAAAVASAMPTNRLTELYSIDPAAPQDPASVLRNQFNP